MRPQCLARAMSLVAVFAVLALACAPAPSPTPTALPPKPAAPAPAVQPTSAPTPRPVGTSPAPTVAPKPAPTVAPKPAPTVAPKPAAVATKPAAAKQDVTLRLAFNATGYDTPFYLARAKGFYDEVGLNVTIGESRGSNFTIASVDNKADTFGWAYSVPVVQAIAKGAQNVKYVAGIVRKDGLTIVALQESGITKPKDLEGKRIGGTAGSSGLIMLPAVFKANNVNGDRVTVIPLDPAAHYPSLLAGRVDALATYQPSAVPALAKQGAKLNVMLYPDFGVNSGGLGIITHQDTIKNNPDLVRRFVEASIKGWEASKANPADAAKATKQAIPETDADVLELQLKETLKLLDSKNTQGKRMGWMSLDDWKEYVSILKQYGGVDSPPVPETIFTNQFVREQ